MQSFDILFYIWRKIILNSRDLVTEVTYFHIIIFLKSVATPSKICTAISFYSKVLKCLSDCNLTRTHNHLIRKRTLNRLAKVHWALVRLRTKWFWIRVQLQSLKLPWHSGNYRVWIHSETRTWHDKNIQSDLSVSLKNIFADIVELAFIGQITFFRNFENNWNKNINFRKTFKIIPINENSFLQMYPNEISFPTY